MINLKEVRDVIANECQKHATCTCCKFNRFRLGICMLKNISDEEFEQLAEIVNDKANCKKCTQDIKLARMQSEIDMLFRAVEVLECLK